MVADPPRPGFETRRTGTPRWRRRLVCGALCLVLGAVTTVGVAWWMPHFGSGQTNTALVSQGAQSISVSVYTGSVGDSVWISAVSQGANIKIDSTSSNGAWSDMASASAAMLPIDDMSELPIASAMPAWTALPPMPPIEVARSTAETSTASTVRAGWPWRAVTSSSYQQDRWLRETPQTLASRTIGQVQIGGTKYPVLPIFPGLALDMLFYAIAWWTIIMTPGAIKRWHRRRTGRCIGCGYDLAGLAAENVARTCPECGAIDRIAAKA